MAEDESLDLLRARPTVEQWEAEIHRIVNGERAYLLVSLGSADELVASIIAQSDDPITSEIRFRSALNSVIERSTFDGTKSTRVAQRVLELISAYRPAAAVPQLLSAFQSRGGVGRAPWLGSSQDDDLERKALTALANYFPAPPLEDPLNVFKAYVDVLHYQLNHPTRAAHAIVRLLELSALSTASDKFREVVANTPQTIGIFAMSLLDPRQRLRMQRLLPELYGALLRVPNGDVTLETALATRGIVIEHSEMNVEATFPDGQKMNLVLPTFRSIYIQRYLERAGTLGLAEFERI